MSCSRGNAAPNEQTKLRLFAASGGYCQNPGCLRGLFLETGSERIHIAEIAHVFAAADHGPRPNPSLSSAERGAFENLILLCSVCHTMVDKAEEDFPDSVLARWKLDHEERLATLFGAIRLASRAEVFALIQGPLEENRVIFNEYGPESGYRVDPESETAAVWKQKVRDRIIPNNRRVLSILETNRAHMLDEEPTVLEQFRQHILDLEARHLMKIVSGAQRRFPEGMEHMMRSA